MSSIEPQPSINPPADGRVERTVLVVHLPTPAHTDDCADRCRTGRHRAGAESWFDLLERALQSWPITLRMAVLVLVLVTGTAAVAAALGVAGQLLLIALGLRAHRRRRRPPVT